MKHIIAFFKKIIEFILKIWLDNKTNFNTFDGDELITSDGKTFLIKEVI